LSVALAPNRALNAVEVVAAAGRSLEHSRLIEVGAVTIGLVVSLIVKI
jgi:hypothetical protein